MKNAFLFVLLTVGLAVANASGQAPQEGGKRLPVLRVNVTSQAWELIRPWAKRPPVTRRAIGAVIRGGHVLVTADLVQNATYVELEVPEGGNRAPASLVAVDYDANLALVKCDDAAFMAGLPELETGASVAGASLSALQLESTGALLKTPGTLTTVEASGYSLGSAFLVYRGTFQLQSRDNSFTLPVLSDGKLTGVVMRYDAGTNSADMIPAPLIQHFLKDAADGKYEGFPRGGFAFSPMRDPALRKYSKVPTNETGGIYVTKVFPGMAASKAGLRKGDVVTAIDGNKLDQDGNYEDPAYGKVNFVNLITINKFEGDPVKVEYYRDGSRLEAILNVSKRPLSSYVSEPYQFDRAPNYMIVGGFMIQELSRQYLKEFGSEWQKRAPRRLVYLDQFQDDLFEDGKVPKIVFVSRVLPTPYTVGYEQIAFSVITRVNDKKIDALTDVAAALREPVGGFHKIEFERDPGTIYLDAAELRSINSAVQGTYKISELERLRPVAD
jgi:S1-C subfamily serine protease